MTTDGKVFVVDDDNLIVTTVSRALRKEGYEVRTAEEPRRLPDKISAWSPDVVLLDIRFPGGSGLDILRELSHRSIETQVVILTGDDTAGTAIEAMKAGAADYIIKPFSLDEVRLIVRNLVEKQRLKRELAYRRSAENGVGASAIVGESEPIRALKEQIRILTTANVDTVLLSGESGTGKELVARRIHLAAHEERGKGYAPFIGINCTAIPENLIESELFGYDTGAFTDAKADKKGVFEQAENGTLLLDEIGDMPRGLQGRLLRVLEERALRRLGGREEIRIDCTVVASTNRDLKAEVAQGRFRKDLYYRLNTFSLDVPPLRKRGNDIIELAEHFLSWFSIRYGKKEPYVLSESCKRKLMGYPWPGNVRELRNVIERIVVLESARLIEPKHLPREIGADRCERNASGHILELPEDGLDFEALKRDLIVQALEKAGHNKMKAARLLGVSYDTLRYQLKRFGLH